LGTTAHQGKRQATWTAALVRVLLPLVLSARERQRPLEVRDRLIESVFGPSSQVLMVAFAALICGVTAVTRDGCWCAGSIAFAQAAILIVRAAVILAFQKRKRKDPRLDCEPWLVGSALLATSASLCWGIFCFACLAGSRDPLLYVLPILSTTGTAGALAARNSGVPQLAKKQLICSLAPICAGCLFPDDHGYRLLLLLVPVFGAGLMMLMSERNAQLVLMIETQIELARLSQTDALTQVPNRRFFDTRLNAEAEAIARPLALLMIDVDDFKAFNDRYGHPEGDVLLRRIAGILSDHLRGTDDVLARYGGEEFAVMLADTTVSDAALIAERLRLAVQDAFGGACAYGPITISVGVVGASGKREARQLIKDADDALYSAKRLGRNRVEIAGRDPDALAA
jgi:diguanylate cyclase (GGDEF)-like protein